MTPHTTEILGETKRLREIFLEEERAGLGRDSRTLAALDALDVAVKALNSECFCPGETSWTTGKEILCDACEALAEMHRLMKREG